MSRWNSESWAPGLDQSLPRRGTSTKSSDTEQASPAGSELVDNALETGAQVSISQLLQGSDFATKMSSGTAGEPHETDWLFSDAGDCRWRSRRI